MGLNVYKINNIFVNSTQADRKLEIPGENL